MCTVILTVHTIVVEMMQVAQILYAIRYNVLKMNMFPIIHVKPVPQGLTMLLGIQQVVLILYVTEIAFVSSENYRVLDHICIECSLGTYNASGDDASGPDTTCDTIQCAENEYVSSHTCQACPAGTYNASGDVASGS